MFQLTADQAEEFDPTAHGWKADILIRLSDFPEIMGRSMVWQRDAYTRGSERLVIEWERDWTVAALARNGHWVTGVTWGVLQRLLIDRYPSINVRVRVVDAPGYADFEGDMILDSESGKVVVDFESNGKRDVAVVPRACIQEIGE